MSGRDTVSNLAEEMAVALEPLADALDSPEAFTAFMFELGWDLSQIPQPIANLETQVQNVLDLVAEGHVDLADLTALTSGIRSLATSIRDLATSPDAMFPTSVNPTEFKATFPAQLIEFLVVEYLLDRAPVGGHLLRTIGVIEIEAVDETATRPAYVRLGFAWDELTKLLDDPFTTFQNAYGWGTSSFAAAEVLENGYDLGHALGIDAEYSPPDAAMASFLTKGAAALGPEHRFILRLPILRDEVPGAGFELGVGIFMLPKTAAEEAGFAILPYGTGTFDQGLELGDELVLEVKSKANLSNGLAALVRPGMGIDFVADIKPSVAGGTARTPAVSFVMSLRTTRTEGEKRILIGSETGSRLETGAVSGTAGIRANSSQELDVFAELGLGKSAIVINPGTDADSFLSSLLPQEGFTIDFGFLLGFSSARGLYFGGSGGLEVSLPTHVSLGPIELVSSVLAVKGDSGGVAVEVGASIDAKLGPLRASIDNMGLRTDFVFPSDSSGNLGPIDVRLAFKPPPVVRLSVDGGGFKGGGLLSFEPDNKRYVGFLELEFKESIALKAIGLLTTELPGGQQGFSLLIVITAEFQPIQLGLGFTLNGVGGLLGLNRTARIERLRTGVRDNTLSNILFPTDVVANANRIISDLREVFPPQADRFVFGPMAKLGWGSPTIITIDLGLIIEVPAPVQLAILGVLRGLIPDDKKKLLRLQVNFLGVLEIEEQRLAFDASLYDSKLLNYPLSGDMALRLAWGNNPNFLLSVGGFHPAYEPPPLALPPLRRLTLQLTSGNNPRLTLETYFAVTSNTAQFGAKVELYASAGAFNVYGMLAFDALFQFNPFYFIADIAAKLALRRGSSSIASITLSLTLEGTTPWRARGTARLKLCWFLTVKVRFDRTFGDTRDTRLDDVAVLPLLRAALQNRQNWRPRLPAGSHLLVTVREPEGVGESIVAHPIGVLEVSQKVVPLNVRIERFGHQKPSDGREFRIENVRANGKSIGNSRVKELFAPAQFFERSDAQKLASKSFEKYDGGIGLSGVEELSSDLYAMREVEYELGYRDSQRDRLPPPARVKPEAIAFNAWASRGAIARSSLSFARTGKSALAPDAVSLTQEGYGVVSMSDLSLVNESSIGASEAEAAALMNDLMARVPTLAGRIQVVPLFEAAGSVR